MRPAKESWRRSRSAPGNFSTKNLRKSDGHDDNRLAALLQRPLPAGIVGGVVWNSALIIPFARRRFPPDVARQVELIEQQDGAAAACAFIAELMRQYPDRERQA
jgi:hypothetical protein